MKIKKNMKFNKKKKVLPVTGICVGILLVTVLAVFLYVNGMLGKIHYSNGIFKPSGSVSNDDTTTSSNSPQSDINSLDSQIEANLKNQSTPIAYDKDVFNILLIGTDTRTGTGPCRSDSMIILSINKKSDKIVMTSILRDIYVSIPGYQDNRINAAYSYGGPDLLIKTIENNFKIKIDRYISVNFMSFIDIINKLNGVTISVSDAELPVLNNYIKEINQLKGLSSNDGFLLNAGNNLKLTGKQALGYARIRYVGTDFARTQRQRTILEQVFTKIKSQNIIEQNQILNMFLPDVTTNLSKGELFSFLLDSVSLSKYPVEEDTIPVEGSYKDMVIRSMDVLGIDFDKNINELQSKIYG
jgi:LCP family protein required for cell wall assembly